MDDECRKKIKDLLISGEVLFDEPMSKHASIGAGGRADALVFPESTKELERLILFLASKNIPFSPVGNCTNLIVREGGYRGALISMGRFRELTKKEEKGEKVFVYAQAGVSLSRMVDFSIKESLFGMEFCAGIPGSVGGGVKMNAGAYGRELKDVLKSVLLVDGFEGIVEIENDNLAFEYRNLNIPRNAIILGATFGLFKGKSRELIEREVLRILGSRTEKHPLEYRSAGFKNPVGCPAGRIIEEIGLKGTRIGDAEISEKHANFIVNLGKATSGDILDLIDLVRKRVFEKKGICLETEVKIIGEG
jgi:UDP-N-acetylmuramate dehydrogenase